MYQLCWYPEGAARIYLDQWISSLCLNDQHNGISQCKVAENCLNPWTAGPTMDTFSQPGGKRGFQNFTIVNNAVNTYPLQLQEAVVSISLSFSSILSVGINIGCRRPPRLGGWVWTLRCRNPIIHSRIWLVSARCQSTLHFITAEDAIISNIHLVICSISATFHPSRIAGGAVCSLYVTWHVDIIFYHYCCCREPDWLVSAN